jgi:hypothetical protein
MWDGPSKPIGYAAGAVIVILIAAVIWCASY